MEDALSDIEDLAKSNPVRPFFLAMHVREFSTVSKVEEIINSLNPDEFDVVSTQTFFELAAVLPT